MAEAIPLTAVPNQVLAVPLDNQSFLIALNQRSTGLFIDIAMNGAPIILGVQCENLNRIVRNAYLGCPGDFFFYDSQGGTDPTYDGLGARYQLIYIQEAEIEAWANGS